jgi:hypothetical protein
MARIYNDFDMEGDAYFGQVIDDTMSEDIFEVSTKLVVEFVRSGDSVFCTMSNGERETLRELLGKDMDVDVLFPDDDLGAFVF